MLEMAAVTEAGQIVFPSAVAERLSSAQVRQMVLYSDGESIILKPVKEPGAGEYKTFMQEAQQYAAENGMTGEDITAAIQQVRAGV